MTLDEFEIQVISACDASPIVVGVAVIGSGITWVRLRAYLTNESFIEAFARIQEGSRVFGADNTGGWHWHPIGTPDEHIRTGEAVSFPLFLQRVEKDLKVKGQ
jgi:hypothetical protein